MKIGIKIYGNNIFYNFYKDNMLLNIKENNITWLQFLNNKIVRDFRGFIWEIIPWWIKNIFLEWKLWHIYTSVAIWKHIFRWWHYHNINIDRFCTLSWTALWIFIDYRKKTYWESFYVILWSKKFNNNLWIRNLTIDNDYMVSVKIPVWVYHLYIPLTDLEVIVLTLASEKHNKKDYIRINPLKIPKIKSLFKNLWIK